MKKLLALLIRCLLRTRYRIEVRDHGLDKLPSEGLLILPNHPGEMDPVIITSLLWDRFQPRPVVVEFFYHLGPIHWLMRLIKAIPMPSMEGGRGSYKRWRISEALKGCGEALNRGDNVLIYPSGRLMRSGLENLGSTSGVREILDATDNPQILLVRTRGLVGSSFSWVVHQHRPDLIPLLLRAAGFAVLNLFVFMPKRTVTVDLQPAPADFPGDGDRQTINRWLEDWYNQPGEELLTLPSYLCWANKPITPVQPADLAGRDSADVPQAVRTRLLKELCRRSSVPADQIADSAKLAHDLGMDSLETADLAMWIEESFHSAVDLEHLNTVADALHAAASPAKSDSTEGVRPPPKAWRENHRPPLRLPDPELGIALNFLEMTDDAPTAVAVADELSGVLSRRRLRTAVVLLAEQFRHLPGDRIGIMLPAGVGATISLLAVQVAGKTPVMINWTVGDNNLQHVITSSGLKKIITAERFLDLVDGISFPPIADRVVTLEQLKVNLGLGDKLRALLLARRSRTAIAQHFNLAKPAPDAVAVVLYTSGSESAPKGVPLTHANILRNILGALSAVQLSSQDVLYGFLPPFHSFGFTITTIMPMTTGMKTAFYPNPTEARNLARGLGSWGATIMAGTPTFVGAIIHAANDDELASLRVIWTGAEKTPDALFAEVDRRTGASMMEGYGITECSPILTVNREGEPRVGVGKPVGDVELLIIDVDSEDPLPQGQQGLILATGSSIFHGYLDRPSDDVFRQIDGRQYYVTGDLGYLDPTGALVLTGRLKRFVKIGGEMVSLPAIEEAVRQRIPDTEDGPHAAITAAEPDGKRPVIALFTTADAHVDEINHFLRDQGFGNLSRIQRVVNVDEIPRLGTGKTNYRAIKAQLEELLSS